MFFLDSVIIGKEEHEEWLVKWEQLTGKCSECTGEGKVFARWNHITGTEYRPCTKCNATGLKK